MIDRDRLVEKIPAEATCAETAGWVHFLLSKEGIACEKINIVGYGHTYNTVDGEIVDIWSYRRGLPEGPN